MTTPSPLATEHTPQTHGLKEMLSAALAHHQNGRLKEASLLYENVNKIDPKNAVAIRLSGVIAYQLSQFELSLGLLSRAIALEPDYAEALISRGLVLMKLKRFKEAFADYTRVTILLPDHAEAFNSRGVCLKNLMYFDEALADYERALAIKADYVEVFNNRGNLLRELKRFDEALADYDKALDLKPDHVSALNNRGNLLRELKRFDEALADYDTVLDLKPDDVSALNNRANLLRELKRFDEALADYDKALSIPHDQPQTLNKRANLLKELKRFDEALADYDKALDQKPDHVSVLNNRANLLKELKRFDEALADYDKALDLEPDYVPVLNNRGRLMTELKRFDEALADYDKAISIDSNYGDAHFNKSIQLLLHGEYKSGWRLYEWRWKGTSFSSPIRKFTKPRWLGNEDLSGKTILLHWEQGLGDTIQFSRFARNVTELGCKTVLEVQKPLFELMKSIEGVDQVTVSGADLPPFDFHCPLMSLPLAFGTTLETIPATIPYIRSTDDKLAEWSDKLGPKLKPRVGIAWSGSASHKNDQNRSMPLEQILRAVPEGFEVLSLQNEVRTTDQNTLEHLDHLDHFKHFGADLYNFTDTAALCELMDVIVSVDTSVAHLAGALGKPVNLLLPHNPDFRWLLDRYDSPWYPTIKLFRQGPERSWKPLLEAVHADLCSFN